MSQSLLLHHADSILCTLYILTLGFVVFLANGPLSNANFWESYTPDPGPWCERDRSTAFVREPSNAYTDFTFLAAGLYMISCAIRDINRIKKESKQGVVTSNKSKAPLNLLRCNPLLSIVFGIANIVHAIGTFTNHSCRCLEGHILDVVGMYSIIFIILCYQALKYIHAATLLPTLFSEKPQQENEKVRFSSNHLTLSDKAMSGFLLVFSAGAFMFYQISQLPYSDPRCSSRETAVVVTMVLLILGFHFLYMRIMRSIVIAKSERVGLATFLLIFAFIAHQLDVAKVFCDPDSIFQGHALWHVCACFSLLTVFNFHYNEDWKSPEKQL